MMRQYDSERDEALDEALHDFCSSPQEARELKKIASMFSDLPRAQSSSSFQSKLRTSLLEKAQSASNNIDRKEKTGFFAAICKFQKKYIPRPLFTVSAAVVVAVVALTMFYSYGLVKTGAGGCAPWSPFTAMIEKNEPEKRDAAEKEPSSAPGKTPAGQVLGKQEKTETEKSDPSAEPSVSNETEENAPPLEDFPPEELEPGEEEGAERPNLPEQDEQKIYPAGQQEEGNAPLRPAPVFATEKNMRSVKLAGKIKLSPAYYNMVATQAEAPVEKVNYAWKPRKIVASMMTGAPFGSSSWAQEILSNEGFSVREGDILVINLQETRKGNFAEVFYNSQKSGEAGPKLALHYEEGKGIIGYFYQEQGDIWQPGFYPLLSPSKAFARAREVEWYAPAARLDFSFQEVFLTYHDFIVVENARQKTQRLPAYCFLGRETFHNGGEFKLYLPAIP